MADEFVPNTIAIWLPRGDEHELAASLGMCEPDPALLRELISAAQAALPGDLPGTHVCVRRWHVWRVVRAMARLGVSNTPAGRSAAYAALLAQSELGGNDR